MSSQRNEGEAMHENSTSDKQTTKSGNHKAGGVREVQDSQSTRGQERAAQGWAREGRAVHAERMEARWQAWNRSRVKDPRLREENKSSVGTPEQSPREEAPLCGNHGGVAPAHLSGVGEGGSGEGERKRMCG